MPTREFLRSLSFGLQELKKNYSYVSQLLDMVRIIINWSSSDIQCLCP